MSAATRIGPHSSSVTIGEFRGRGPCTLRGYDRRANTIGAFFLRRGHALEFGRLSRFLAGFEPTKIKTLEGSGTFDALPLGNYGKRLKGSDPGPRQAEEAR